MRIKYQNDKPTFDKGFSLIELLAALVIVGVLVKVAVVGYQAYVTTAKQDTVKSQLALWLSTELTYGRLQPSKVQVPSVEQVAFGKKSIDGSLIVYADATEAKLGFFTLSQWGQGCWHTTSIEVDIVSCSYTAW